MFYHNQYGLLAFFGSSAMGHRGELGFIKNDLLQWVDLNQVGNVVEWTWDVSKPCGTTTILTMGWFFYPFDCLIYWCRSLVYQDKDWAVKFKFGG